MGFSYGKGLAAKVKVEKRGQKNGFWAQIATC